MKSQKYDLDRLKRVPILLVAEQLGIRLVKTGADTWQERDGDSKDKVTSLTMFGKTNSFVRFSGKTKGGKDKGSVIDFVMHVTDNPDLNEACAFLSRFL